MTNNTDTTAHFLCFELTGPDTAVARGLVSDETRKQMIANSDNPDSLFFKRVG